jgi:hypothetical protein
VALSLGEDRGQESYPTGCIDSRGGNRARRLRSEDGDGVDGATAAAPAELCPTAAAGTLCRSCPGAEAVCVEAEARPPYAAPREEDDDHDNDDDGPEPVTVVRVA